VDKAQAGCIRLGQRPVEALPAHEIAALGVARTFQNLKLFARLSVLDNVLTGLTVAAERSFVVSMLRLPALRHQERQLQALSPGGPGRFRAGTPKRTGRHRRCPTEKRNGWKWPAPS
jgi:ABC-type branched-subunit amino acid transport system ATPase component